MTERRETTTYDGTTGNHNIYTFEPVEGNDNEVRVEFQLPDGTLVTSDEFEIADTLDEVLTMSVYMGGIEEGYVSVEYEGENYPLSTMSESGEELTGELTIRSSTDQLDYGEMVDSETKVPEGEPGLIASAESTYFINDSDVQVADPSGVKLLFDEIIDENAGNTETTDLLVDRTKKELANELGDSVNDPDRGFEAKYLDLVDTNNGNAWVACEKPVTVCWPIPEGVDPDSEFHVLHFKGLHREMRADDVAGDIASCEVEEMPIEVSGDHITFQVTRANFSPFVLTWGDGSAVGGSTVEDGLPKDGLPETGDDSFVGFAVAFTAGCAMIGGAVYLNKVRG